MLLILATLGASCASSTRQTQPSQVGPSQVASPTPVTQYDLTCFTPAELARVEAALDKGGGAIWRAQAVEVFSVPQATPGELRRDKAMWFALGGLVGVICSGVIVVGGVYLAR
jgi:hypothetical protein